MREPKLVSERLRRVRSDLYGQYGAPELARELGLPVRTWLSYELGAAIPAKVLLHFLVLTRAEPLWLLRGEGQQYNTAAWSSLLRCRGVAPETEWGEFTSE
jgi:hypothetical protein